MEDYERNENKVLRPDEVPVEVWKVFWYVKHRIWMKDLINKLLVWRKMPEEWRNSCVVGTYFQRKRRHTRM